MPKAPEQEASARTDAQLAACGWAALREVRLKSGPCDYLLLVDRKPVHQLFGAALPSMLDELNEAMPA